MRLFGRGPSKEVLERARKLGLLEGEVVYLEKYQHAESLRDLWDKEVKGVPLIVRRILYYLDFKGVIRVEDLSKEFQVEKEQIVGFLVSFLKKKGGDFFVSGGWVLPLSEEKVLSVIVQLDNLFRQFREDRISYPELASIVELLVSLKHYAIKINNNFLLEACESKLREIKLRLQQVSREELHSMLEDLYVHLNQVRLLEEQLSSFLNSGSDSSLSEIIKDIVVLFESATELNRSHHKIENRLVNELESLTDKSKVLQAAGLASSLTRLQEEYQAISTQYSSMFHAFIGGVLKWLKERLILEINSLQEQNNKILYVLRTNYAPFEEMDTLMKNDQELFSRFEELQPKITVLLQHISTLLADLDFIELLRENAQLKALFSDYQGQYETLQANHSQLIPHHEKYALIQQIHSLSESEQWEETLALTKQLLHHPLLSSAEKPEWK